MTSAIAHNPWILAIAVVCLAWVIVTLIRKA